MNSRLKSTKNVWNEQKNVFFSFFAFYSRWSTCKKRSTPWWYPEIIIFWPAFGCWALQMLVEICVFQFIFNLIWNIFKLTMTSLKGNLEQLNFECFKNKLKWKKNYQWRLLLHLKHIRKLQFVSNLAIKQKVKNAISAKKLRLGVGDAKSPLINSRA